MDILMGRIPRRESLVVFIVLMLGRYKDCLILNSIRCFCM